MMRTTREIQVHPVRVWAEGSPPDLVGVEEGYALRKVFYLFIFYFFRKVLRR